MAMSKLSKKEARRRAEFEALLLPHLDSLYGTAMRMTRRPEEAEDLLQDACLKAFRFIDRYEPGTNFKAWIFKVLTNVFINRYHKAQRGHEVVQEILAEGHYEHVLAQGPRSQAHHPEEKVVDALMSQDIQRALATLPPDFRMAVLLSDVEEFSYKEIAEIMDCPVGTVMSRLYRARRLLQRQLLDHARDRGFAAAENSVSESAETDVDAAEVTDLSTYRQTRRQAKGQDQP
jgi:RNA polymerase sigma-70 factor (ECF subfamily)